MDEGWQKLQLCEGSNVNRARFENVDCAASPSIYQRFIRSIEHGHNDQPDFARGAELQRVLDSCFESDREDRTLTL